MPLTRDEFIARYGGVYEHSAWVADKTYTTASGTSDTDILAKLFADCVDDASMERKLELIRAHPDLAGKASIAGELTEASSEEQSSAGIDRCTPEEYAEFQILNARYKKKFGFPFVMAVRNSNRCEILDVFSERLGNDKNAEFETAMKEIHKIARMRLEALRKS